MTSSSSRPSAWKRWVNRPQTLSWRRFLATIHLWVGLALAVYVFVFSLTGSLIVLRPEFHRWVTQPVIEIQGARPTAEKLEGALRRAYPDSHIDSVRQPRRPDIPFVVRLTGNGETRERLFDPYAGADLGSANPPMLRAVEWLVDLHDNLLAGRTGRLVNGLGGILLTALTLTGLIIWWPGRSYWRKALWPGKPAWSPQFASRLHLAMGFWVSSLVLVWALTAVYFAFPGVFDGLIDLFDRDPTDEVRPGEHLLELLVRLHFGRFGGMTGRVAWIVLGLMPLVLVVTGCIVWLKRRGGAARVPLGASLGKP
jgi:uncharacterized iron-regulated membrane protein